MLFNTLQYTALAAVFLPFISAQSSVPADLSRGFSDSTDIQVSYTNDATNGFKDGTKFAKNGMCFYPITENLFLTNTIPEVANVPTFALGDSSGIIPDAFYTVIMVDTTEDSARTLHYAHSNFQITEIVNIASKDAPALAYKAPGSLGETGERKYTFLLYQHIGNERVNNLKLQAGDKIDVKKFQSDNGFRDADAGRGIVVDLSSQAEPSSSSVSRVSSSTVRSEVPTSAAAVQSTTRSSSIVTRVSSTTVSSSTGRSEIPESTAAQTSGTTARTTDEPVASSVFQEPPSTSTIAGGVSSGGTLTGTGTPAQQTGSASDLALGTASCAVGAAMLVFAGLLAW